MSAEGPGSPFVFKLTGDKANEEERRVRESWGAREITDTVEEYDEVNLSRPAARILLDTASQKYFGNATRDAGHNEPSS